jgi:hypothetical protein
MATTEQLHLVIAPAVRIEQTRRRHSDLAEWPGAMIAPHW